MRRTRRWAAGLGLLGVGALAAREAAAIVRVVRAEDAGGRHDHARTLGTGLGEPLHLLLLGDSAVDGYGLTADEAMPLQVAARLAASTGRRVSVRSVAVSGATSVDVAEQQIPLLRAAGPLDAIVIGVGVNDALRRTDTGVVEAATQAIVAGLHDLAPDAAVAFLPCHDLGGAPGLGPVVRRVVGVRCRRVSAVQRTVLEAANIPVVQPERRGTVDAFGRDGLHPGARGVEALSSLVANALVAR